VSDQWWQKRRDWLEWWLDGHDGEDPACVVCGEPWAERRDDLHHRTYARLGHEQPEDLTPMCRTCHTRLHDIIDTSPGWRRADRAVATDMIVRHLRAAEERERTGW